jgi:predicted transcriptional regulator
MAANRKYLIHIPAFSEYLYRIFMSTSEEDKKVLTESERLLIQDEKSTHHFVTNEPLEKLLFIASKLGLEITMNVGPSEKQINEAIESTRYQYDHDLKRLDSVGVIARHKVCTISSREIMATAIMCAQNCNTDVYHITAYTKDMMARSTDITKRPYDKTIASANDAALTVNKILLEQLNALPYWKQTTDLDQSDMRILSALFAKRHSSMTLLELATMTRQENKKMYLGKNVDRLISLGLIISDRKEGETKAFGKKQHYLLTTKGVEKIMGYLYYVWENAFQNK